MTPVASATLKHVAPKTWDAIVIGAGPAGALAARQLALGGLQTMLIEAKKFPRSKVCGGCLNQRAISALATCGLDRMLARCAAVPLDWLRLQVGGRETQLRLPGGAAICRAEFDAELVGEATQAGVEFLSEATAIVEPEFDGGRRQLTVSRAGQHVRLCTRQLVCADGLSRSSLRRLPEFQSYHPRTSRIGVGAVIAADLAPCRPSTVEMLIVREGYIGRANLAGDRVSIAAAFDAAAFANQRPGEVVARLMGDAHIEVDDRISEATWQGTPPLTSRPNRVAARQLFLIGDAGGYIEPFTGEGMAAALESAIAVAPLVIRGHRGWQVSLAADWGATHRRLLRRREVACRALAWMLRRPAATNAALAACHLFPFVARALISKINHVPHRVGYQG